MYSALCVALSRICVHDIDHLGPTFLENAGLHFKNDFPSLRDCMPNCNCMLNYAYTYFSCSIRS